MPRVVRDASAHLDTADDIDDDDDDDSNDSDDIDTADIDTADELETAMKSDAVEQCLASRIKSWKFPEPRGDGFVVVTYPFVFKHTPPAAAPASPAATPTP